MSSKRMAVQELQFHIPATTTTIFCSLLLMVLKEITASSMAKPNCPEKCGEVTVPYPFGIGEGCYMNNIFEVTCNHSSNSAFLPFLNYSRVFQISMDSLRISSPAAIVGCHNQSSGRSNMGQVFYGSDQIFSFSRRQNNWVAIGCDIFAYITELDTVNYISGCASLCYNTSMVGSAAANLSDCSGIGCCRTSLTEHLFSFGMHIYTMNTDTLSWVSSPCSIAFIAEKNFSDFTLYSDQTDISGVVDYKPFHGPPVVLDWTTANISCREAQTRKDYACGRNSLCIDATHGIGYGCHCLEGYHGNPYLANGCTDIDECKEPAMNTCRNGARCNNTEGSYTCICPTGYHNNHGYGCVPGQTMLISLGTGIAICVLASIVIGLWFCRALKQRHKSKIKQKFFKRNGGLLLQQQISASKESVVKTRLFVTEELKKATENFNGSRVIGKGGLGTVYKGMLTDGSIVAVKKSNIIDQNQIGQFINEVIILSHINHRNIVKLLGCCLETEVPLLVYEYVSNGTLSHHLHNEADACKISWKDRLRIAGEVAEALAYLHSHASTAIFHRDIKSSNILLDENYRAVVSDFGLSRSVALNKTHLTTLVGGTFGYLDPEYFRSGQLTDKSDVYSFGVVLAELLTGKKAVSSDRADEGLVLNFRSSMKQNRLFDILETQVANEGKEEEIYAVARLAKRCLKLTSRKRPSMKEVAAELDQLRRLEDEPPLVQQNSLNSYCSTSERSYSYTIDHPAEEEDSTQDHIMSP